jgi:UDP-N-acetylglucosamine acyltransferase
MIHPLAVVSPQAQVAPDAYIGPFCIVEASVQIDSGVRLESRVHVYGGVHIHAGCRVWDGAVIGADPQDLKYTGESTYLQIGANTRIREYCTLNRGTGHGGCTYIGPDSLLMAYVHIGHDCVLQNGVILANGVQLGGHVHIGKHALIGGGTAVQQFSRIGAYCYVGGTLKIDKDIPPASKAFGIPLGWAGINAIGLQRHSFSQERIEHIRNQLKFLYSGRSMQQKIQELLQTPDTDPLLLEFLTQSNPKSTLLGLQR